MSRDLVLLGLSLLAWGIGEGMFMIFLPLYLQQLGADPVAIGVIFGAAGIMMALAHIPAGILSDRIGRKPLLMAAWIIAMLATWVMAFSISLPLFIFAMLMYNLTAFVSSPLSSYVTAASDKMGVTRALTTVSAFFSFGLIFGPALGGVIGDHFGLKTIFFISGITFIVSFIILVFIKSQPVMDVEPEEAVNYHFVNRRFLIFLSVVLLAGFSMWLVQPLSPNYLQNQQNYSFGQIGLLGSIMSLGTVFLNLTLGSINAFTGYILAQLFVGLFALIMWRTTGFAWYSVAYFLLGGYRMSRSFATALTRNLVHIARIGLAYGMTETVGSAAVILAPPAAGFLYQIDPQLMYIVGFCLIIFSILVSTGFIPRPKAGELA